MNKKYVSIAIILIGAAVAGWLLLSRTSEQPAEPTSATGNQNLPADEGEKANATAPAAKGSTLEGVLKASNSPKKGNLMIETQGKTIYIFTSRDYSSLIGKQVVVTYDGTMEDFRLGDIMEK